MVEHILKNGLKNKCVCFGKTNWLIIMKMKIIMKINQIVKTEIDRDLELDTTILNIKKCLGKMSICSNQHCSYMQLASIHWEVKLKLSWKKALLIQKASI